jgi:acyl-ACP thioesterase
MTAPYRLHTDLRTLELDHRGRAPLSVLCRFMQEAAEMHSVAMGLDVENLRQRHLTWVLVRFHIRVSDYPAGRQPLTVETWPTGMDGRWAYREFRFLREGADKPFALGTSVWSMVDLNRGRPIRILDQFPRYDIPLGERVVAGAFPDIRPAGDVVDERRFPVRLADLDINGHVNNLHYIEWVIESGPGEAWRTHEIESLNLEYRGQARYGDTVHALCHPAAESAAPEVTLPGTSRSRGDGKMDVPDAPPRARMTPARHPAGGDVSRPGENTGAAGDPAGDDVPRPGENTGAAGNPADGETFRSVEKSGVDQPAADRGRAPVLELVHFLRTDPAGPDLLRARTRRRPLDP